MQIRIPKILFRPHTHTQTRTKKKTPTLTNQNLNASRTRGLSPTQSCRTSFLTRKILLTISQGTMEGACYCNLEFVGSSHVTRSMAHRFSENEPMTSPRLVAILPLHLILSQVIFLTSICQAMKKRKYFDHKP